MSRGLARTLQKERRNPVIELEIAQFFTAILLGAAVVVGVSALLTELRERRSAKAVRRGIVRCRICGAAYRGGGTNLVQECPECGNRNRCGRDRRLG